MAEVCERIIWSGGGAEASWGEVIVKVKERRRRHKDIFGHRGCRAGTQSVFIHC